MTQPNEIRKAMISSTARDLPEHRKEVLEACQRQGFFAARMEDLPAYGATAKSASLKMVDEADIYIGVFAHRYGYIPDEDNPDRISVTEMEYNRAVEMKKPRLIFVMDPAHPITIDQVETGEGAAKLKTFLDRVTTDNIVRFYKSPTDLRAEAINSLSQHLIAAAKLAAADDSAWPKPAAAGFHYVSAIPAPPQAYIAHPYSLLQTPDLIGRQDELSLLTDWVAKPDSKIFNAHILSISAIGGMGKSALTWKWFNDIAPQEMKLLAGRMWWSFYESDASFENFLTRALAYATIQTIEQVRQIAMSDREAALISVLDHEPYLIVLDGLERLLIAYARGDATRLKDSEVGSGKNLRKTADPRVGQFLRKLVRVKRARILLSTRLFPTELETDAGDPLPGVFNRELAGLSEGDAVELWRVFGVTGARESLRPVFDAIERHPLLIQALAGEIKRFKPAPGKFEEWYEHNPQFDPARFHRVQDAMAHVMEYALRDLGERSRHVLNTIAAFRMPTGFQTLSAILVGDKKPHIDEMELDASLVELEDRGLVGWDRLANRYDLHPIVRSVAWSVLKEDARKNVYGNLHAYFYHTPISSTANKVRSLADIAPAIELYNTLVGLGRFDDAFAIYHDRLADATHRQLCATRQQTELLELLFPDGTERSPRLSQPVDQVAALNALALGYWHSGHPQFASTLFHRANVLDGSLGREGSLIVGLRASSGALRVSGSIFAAERAARVAIGISRHHDSLITTQQVGWVEAESLESFGLILCTRGETVDSKNALGRSHKIFSRLRRYAFYSVDSACRSQCLLWIGDYEGSARWASRAWNRAQKMGYEAEFIVAARLQGEAALAVGNFHAAEECLNHSLRRARNVNLIGDEILVLISLTELKRRQGDRSAGREFIDDV